VIEESILVKNIFKNGFKLHVYASFMNIADLVGLDVCEKLSEALIQSGFDEDAFKLVIRAAGAQESQFFQVTESEFDVSFIASHLDLNCIRAYICGPPKFNETVPRDLKALGLPAERITLA